MRIQIDITPFRRSRTQPAIVWVNVDNGSTLCSVLRQLAADWGDVWGYLIEGVGRGEVYFAVNDAIVRDLTFKLTDGDTVIALPVLGGG